MDRALHFNSPSSLPPVGCPLLIRLPCGAALHVERTGYLQDRNGQMEYRLQDGRLIVGRYEWTYP